ncbi:MAG: substrate-binding domain-containing protein [Verrucomicrobiota bacterium]|nr:substrate-binding domain-containing protein [Verrucomicrobiota bacterium]
MNPFPRILLFAFCCIVFSFSPSLQARAYKIAVIPKGTSHEFWKSIHAGAIKAKQELEASGDKVTIVWKGPLREDDRDLQIQVVENFIAQRVDGIVLAPLDSQALVGPVETAMQTRIPVVIIDSALKTDRITSYVSTDNYKGGQLGARHLANLLNGSGKVILLRYQVGSASTEEREAGFLDTMKKEFPKIELISSDQYAGATRDSAYQAAQNLLNRHGREVQGVFCPCEPITIGMTMALRDINRARGIVKIVGFDAGAQSVDALKKGDVQGLVVQNPVKMGYLGVKAIVAHLNKASVEKKVDTGVVVITPDNMKEPAMQELLYPPLDKYLK